MWPKGTTAVWTWRDWTSNQLPPILLSHSVDYPTWRAQRWKMFYFSPHQTTIWFKLFWFSPTCSSISGERPGPSLRRRCSAVQRFHSCSKGGPTETELFWAAILLIFLSEFTTVQVCTQAVTLTLGLRKLWLFVPVTRPLLTVGLCYRSVSKWWSNVVHSVSVFSIKSTQLMDW